MPQHIDDIIAAKPAAVWLQSGIRNVEAEEAFARAGIKVVLPPWCSTQAVLIQMLWLRHGIFLLWAAAAELGHLHHVISSAWVTIPLRR